ncbi:PREDICTED: LDLR chaperone boca isoform X1 [Ceratosolen solmsi marchali]|uniref:LDLR chaperone boca isoform X1 n=1 Tax=Ceratosolen solmsi marchali TaxID=326594 RepID=A0AAJ6YQ74_9HYME|nr:PREDICTED: LDLR chaperone boca isoform X1 [Ceratosolen solmsi marchali]XP_011502179.1 PREDICTED: LDLR chaperone boca isoform X1 [Ceratosolen solmsi marchali]
MEIRSIFTKWGFILLFVVYSILWVNASEADKPKVRKIGKDVRDMTDADLEILLDQWEQDDDPLEPDELPEHLRPQPNIDLSKVDLSNPDNILKVSKKGKSTMMFVDVNPELTQSEADNILSIWQTSLQNNHIIAERFPIDQKRAIFMFRDGSQVVDAKNFLIEQPECSYVTLEGQNYIGKYASTVSNVS